MTKNNFLLSFVILSTCSLALSTILTGCGYTTRSAITDKYKTIFVTPFGNKIDITGETDAARKYKLYKPALETDVTSAVANKFLFYGNLRPVKSAQADLTLKGTVVEFRRDPLRYSSNDDVLEYRIGVKVNMSLWDNKEKKVLWSENNFTGEYTYYTTGSSAISDDQAINKAIDDLARRIVERTVEEW